MLSNVVKAHQQRRKPQQTTHMAFDIPSTNVAIAINTRSTTIFGIAVNNRFCCQQPTCQSEHTVKSWRSTPTTTKKQKPTTGVAPDTPSATEAYSQKSTALHRSELRFKAHPLIHHGPKDCLPHPMHPGSLGEPVGLAKLAGFSCEGLHPQRTMLFSCGSPNH